MSGLRSEVAVKGGCMRSILVTVGVALAVACLTVVASAAGERREYRVLYGGPEKSQRRKTCDVVNGEPQILESQIGFLLRAPEESKYYDVERLAESVPLEVALRGCRLTFPEGLAVEVVDLEVGVANVATTMDSASGVQSESRPQPICRRESARSSSPFPGS